MKALAILGSRNSKGLTAQAAEALLAGLPSGTDVKEMVFLPEMQIERCRQCDEHGWGICRSAGKCVIDDDFAELVDRIARADVVVFANPVYWGDLSESMRAFLDRLRRTCVHEDGKKVIEGKRAFGICMAGGSGGGTAECIVSLEKVLKRCGFDVVDMVPVRRQNHAAKMEILKTAGGVLLT